MKIIRPFQVTDAALITCNAPENDYARWSAATTYTAGDKVMLANPTSDVTVSVGTPAVIGWPDHGLSANTPIVLLTTGTLPTGLAASTVYYLKTGAPAIAGDITTPALGGAVIGGYYCPTNKSLYAFNSIFVLIINPETNTYIGIGCAGINNIVYSPINDKIYGVSPSDNKVYIIDPVTNTVSATTITVGTTPHDITYCSSNQKLYVTNYGAASISVIDPLTNTVTATITAGMGTNPEGIIYCPTGDRIYVANYGSNNVALINPTTDALDVNVAVGANPYRLVYCPTGDRVYVSNSGTNTVSLINPVTKLLDAGTPTITVGTTPKGLAYAVSNDRVYVANYGSNTVSLINPTTKALDGTTPSITTGTLTNGVTYNSDNGRIYVSRETSVVIIATPSGLFNLSLTAGGANINTSGTQTGYHSAIALTSPLSSAVTISTDNPSTITWAAHGFVNDQKIMLWGTGTLPNGFTSLRAYYIINATTNTFQLSNTAGGVGIATTTVGGTGVLYYAALQEHKNYESVIAANLNLSPHSNTYNPDTNPTGAWLDIGYVNRWKMFDQSNTSQTRNDNVLTCNVRMIGRIDSVALINVSAASVTITGTDAIAGVVYGPTTYSLRDNSAIGDWWTYFFEPIVNKSDWIDNDFPPYNNLLMTVELSNPYTSAAVGAMVFGLSKTLGSTQYGANVGIMDYSVKQRDTFGNYSVLERAFSKRAKFTLWVDSSLVDSVVSTLTTYRATPAVYSGVNGYQSTIIYGFYKDFNVDIAYPSMTVCSLDVEGLT